MLAATADEETVPSAPHYRRQRLHAVNTVRSSLLVPCYNAAHFLPRLWEAVRAQTRPFDEIICYDDASTDDTAAVARSFGASVIRGKTNAGPAHARNQLWRAARNDWVHFHDADDLLDPRFLEKMSALAEVNTDVVICNALWFHSNGEVEREWRYSEPELRAAPVPYLLTHPVGGINGLYRRTALEAIGGYDESLKVWEDADLHVRLAANGSRFRVVEESLVSALRREDSLSAEMRNNWRNRLAALESYAHTLPTSVQPVIAAEAEITAGNLLSLGDTDGARQAITLCARLGHRVPSTSHPLLRALRPWVPALTLLAWQRRWRTAR
jgi:GT2 family glycosyltransferase